MLFAFRTFIFYLYFFNNHLKNNFRFLNFKSSSNIESTQISCLAISILGQHNAGIYKRFQQLDFHQLLKYSSTSISNSLWKKLYYPTIVCISKCYSTNNKVVQYPPFKLCFFFLSFLFNMGWSATQPKHFSTIQNCCWWYADDAANTK